MTREQWANYLKPWVKGYGDGNEINAMALADNILAAIDQERKSKVRRTKGQAWLNYDTMEIEAVKANHEHGMYIGKQVPCTILIDEKYLKEAK